MIRSITTLSVATCAATLFLAGCAAQEGNFPSLSKRPFEKQDTAIAAPPPSTPIALALPADVAAKVDKLMARHAKAANAFSVALPAMRALANGAAGSPVGSEAWVNAQEQLSRLDKVRADSVTVQGELDQLIMEQNDIASKTDAPSLIELLSPYQSDVAAAVVAQTAEIERMATMLGV